ncbi:MAG: hypothetical protein WDN69_25995 [Aliidongia sp.]
MNERDIESRAQEPVPRLAKLRQTGLQDLDPAICIASADGQLGFEAASDRQIRPHGMGFGMRDEPLDMLFGAFEDRQPKETRKPPRSEQRIA